MSLFPPNQLMMSKLKFFLKSKLTSEEFENLYPKLEPFPKFRLHCSFKNIFDGEFKEYTDNEIIKTANLNLTSGREEIKINQFDDSDKALYSYTSVRKSFISTIQDKGLFRISLQSSDEKLNSWSDIYVDEFPVNIIDNNLESVSEEEKLEEIKVK